MKKLAVFLLVLLLGNVALGATVSTQKKNSEAKHAQATVADALDFFLNILSSEVDDCWHRGDYNGAIHALKLQIKLDPQWPTPYDSAAWLLWSTKRFKEAEALYKQGIVNCPGGYQLHFELARMYLRTSRPSLYGKQPKNVRALQEKAVEQLYLAIKYPAPPEVHRLLATILQGLGRYQEARQVLEKVLKKNPTDIIAQRELRRLREQGK